MAVRRLRELPDPGPSNFPDRLRAAAVEVVAVPRVAEILASEIGILYFALFSWTWRTEESASTFSVHRKDSYGVLVTGILIVMGVEIIPVHLLADRFSGSLLAWVLTLLTLYGALWIVGDYRALRLRPMTVAADGFALRLGLRWQADIPWEQVTSFRRLDRKEEPDKDGVTLVAVGRPAFLLETRETVTIMGFYGFRKKSRRLFFDVDDRDAFEDSFRLYLEN